ncbi:hypothetical protein [Deinococcus radiophilus]
MSDFLAALVLGLGLIMAIGPQNAFVIRQACGVNMACWPPPRVR